jgi:cardiolipin synthase
MPTAVKFLAVWRYLNWPNRISLLRLLLVPPFVVLMLHHRQQAGFRHAALGIFLVMALSDLIDGHLARRFGLRSRLGAILDPLADKTLIICAAVLLALDRSAVETATLPDWVVVMIVGKDLWVIVGFALLFVMTGKAHVRPTVPGKLCTVGQLAMVTAILASPDLNRLGGQLGFHLAQALWWTVAVLCVLAVLAYTREGVSFMAVSEASRHANQQPAGDEQRQDVMPKNPT